MNNPFIAAAKVLAFLLAVGLMLWGIWLLLSLVRLQDPFPTVIMIILVLICLGLAYAHRGWFADG